jgi:branched-subunit amino acid ABC-type transport system permease component
LNLQTLLQLLIIGVANGAVVAVSALGFTLVYGIVRRISFAHGEVFALCTVMVGNLVVALGFKEVGNHHSHTNLWI